MLTGRDKQVRPQLDSLFALPGAAVTLQTAMDVVATGVGGVCYRQAEGPAFVEAEAELVAFLDSDEGPDVERVPDGFGFTWLISRWPADDVGSLVTDLHAVNTSLQDQGFARSLLASVVGFRSATGQPLGLVYRYTTGTFYPFAPLPGKRERDVLLELQVKTQLQHEMPLEADQTKQFPLWDCPVLA
ncbi:hypothetical protein D9V37_11205 [Nocardioides mangrovicus]|uniref:Uncharacterized protein n=1 Tax=Nocardioides mangrovicus TaxID=2478913 RepID=A0A3L8P372_9ACTN|nr:hypothetical protein D9V37_11205 [Nocardioides mangrovicus]